MFKKICPLDLRNKNVQVKCEESKIEAEETRVINNETMKLNQPWTCRTAHHMGTLKPWWGDDVGRQYSSKHSYMVTTWRSQKSMKKQIDQDLLYLTNWTSFLLTSSLKTNLTTSFNLQCSVRYVTFPSKHFLFLKNGTSRDSWWWWYLCGPERKATHAHTIRRNIPFLVKKKVKVNSEGFSIYRKKKSHSLSSSEQLYWSLNNWLTAVRVMTPTIK